MRIRIESVVDVGDDAQSWSWVSYKWYKTVIDSRSEKLSRCRSTYKPCTPEGQQTVMDVVAKSPLEVYGKTAF